MSGALLYAVLVSIAIAALLWRFARGVVKRRSGSPLNLTVAFDASPLPSAIICTADQRVVAVNDAAVRWLGASRDRLLASTLRELGVAGGDLARVIGELDRAGSVMRSTVAIERGGVRRIVSVFGDRFMLGGESHTLVVLDDITEREAVDAARRESEARFAKAFDASPLPSAIARARDRVIVAANEEWLAAFGCSRADILGKSAGDIGMYANEEDGLRIREKVAREGRARDVELQFLRRDGQPFDAMWSIETIEIGGELHHLGTLRDITDRKRADANRRSLEDQLRQTQKMESLGMLAGGVAHDFNNVLAVIASSSGLLAEALPATGEERELVEEIDAAVQRATSLTRQLLAFSRKQVVEPKVIDVNAAVQDTRKMLRRMVGEDVLLQTSLEPELGHVKVDPGYLVQVLMNLAVNARDAMPRGGTLEIATRRVVIDDAQVHHHRGVASGPAVELSVIDSGCGIPRETLAHIFEPFFTTKEQGKGTGMGLAVVLGIVEQAGGFIEVDSEVGRGTTFRVYLPIVDAQVDRRDEVAGALALGAERILLVDDDDHVRRAAARALRARGYTVVEAADGRAALLQLHEKVDLLLTDVVMPRMDGRELAELAQRACPGLKVLYTSGYTDDAIVRHGVADGNFDLIEKPFRVQTLATRIRQVLDR